MPSNKHRCAQASAPWLGAKLWFWLGTLALAAGVATLRPATAQEPAQPLSAAELEELVGPIALYPDDLVGIVLPAATYPLEIVEAARFLEEREDNASLKPDEDWDDSVVALLNYPEVVRLLNDDLDWTWDLGTAVLNQRADVLDAIQDFRDRAYTAGNLRSDERQVVTQDNGAIAIAPADPEVIYVPYYEPRRVVVYQSAPVYHYYPWSYPVYYYPYPAGYSFGVGFFWGVTTAFTIGWHTHDLHVHHYGYSSHPYYGWGYYNPYYVRHYVDGHHGGAYYGGNVWQPHYRYGNRPVVRGQEGRVTTVGGPPRVGSRATGSATSSTYRSRSTEGSVSRAPRTDTMSRTTRAGAQSTTPSREYRVGRTPPATIARTPTRPQVGSSTRSTAAPRAPVRVEERSPAQSYRGRESSAALRNGSSPQTSGGMSGTTRGSRGVEARSAPRTPAPSGSAAAPRGNGGSGNTYGGGSSNGGSGGAYRGGSSNGGRQQPSAGRGGGQSRSNVR